MRNCQFSIGTQNHQFGNEFVTVLMRNCFISNSIFERGKILFGQKNSLKYMCVTESEFEI